MARYGMVMDIRTCVGCDACSASCSIENQTPYWDDKYRTKVLDIETGVYPQANRQFVPTICMHCEEPACVDVCPSGASFVNDGGFVLVDYDKCMGCRACVAACPYDARYIYSNDDVKKSKELYGEELAQHEVAHVDKCTFCYDRVEQGMQPACVATCPESSRVFGDLDDPNSEVAKLVNSGVAKPLRPELGTKPKVFYIW